MTAPVKTPPTLENLRAQREAILRLADRYGAYNVRVFGSVARGEATPDSDIDIMISAHQGVSMFDLVGLWLDLQDLLESPVSLVTDDDNPRRERFLRRALREAVTL